MIAPSEARVGFHVFYQQPHMRGHEYGVIVRIQRWPEIADRGGLIHVLFFGDTTAKACSPRDLHWPPDYCKADRVNPPGQPFNADGPVLKPGTDLAAVRGRTPINPENP